MVELVLAAIIVWALVVGSKYLAKANPATLAKHGKKVAGAALLAGAAIVLLKGDIDAAIPLGGAGLWLLGLFETPAGLLRSAGLNFGRAARPWLMRGSAIEIESDGQKAYGGRVLSGTFAGRTLAELDRDECFALWSSLRAFGDADSTVLLEFYLDGRFPGWRTAGERDGDPSANRRAGGSSMTEKNAHQILGLAQGASREEIARAHRSLMKRVHPDHGGTASLAALLNEAKDVLLRGHERTPER